MSEAGWLSLADYAYKIVSAICLVVTGYYTYKTKNRTAENTKTIVQQAVVISDVKTQVAKVVVAKDQVHDELRTRVDNLASDLQSIRRGDEPGA